MMSRNTAVLTLLLIGFGCGFPTALQGQQPALDLPKLAKAARPAVMLLIVYDGTGKEIATATGFLVSSDGKLITNYHVIANAAKVVAKAENGGIFTVAGVLAQDAKADLALLKLEGKDLPALTLGSAEKIEAGTRIAVIGSPLGLEGTLSEGIVSAVRDMPLLGQRWLQITAAISPGSSGSPVLNEKGEVIGVATALLHEGQSLNFAVPVESVKKLLAEGARADKVQPLGQGAQKPQDRIFADPDCTAAGAAESAADYVMVLKHAKELVARYPDHDFAYFVLGVAYHKLHFLDEAIVAYKQSIKIKPDYAAAWNNLGVAYDNAKQFAEAIFAYKQAIKIKPDDAEAWCNLGLAYAYAKQLTEAIAAHKQAIKIKPDYAAAWNNLAIAYALDGQKDEALKALEELRKLDPVMAAKLDELMKKNR